MADLFHNPLRAHEGWVVAASWSTRRSHPDWGTDSVAAPCPAWDGVIPVTLEAYWPDQGHCFGSDRGGK